MDKIRVLLFSNWFSPGYKGGGSQAAATNLVTTLKDEFDFWVVTRDRDLGDLVPFRNIQPGRWMHREGIHTLHLSPYDLHYSTIRDIVRSVPHDVMHINSVVSRAFSALPVLCKRTTSANSSILISPHGELSLKALNIKAIRKKAYLGATKYFGLFSNSTWHAASELEKVDIERVYGRDVKPFVAPVIPTIAANAITSFSREPKESNRLRVAFLSRIDRMKNLDLAIDVVSSVPNVTLDIYGPIGQADYWTECKNHIDRSARPGAFFYRGEVHPREVLATLSQYDLFFQPSESENFGYSILEAMAAGCPVLIGDRTPWNELERAGVGFDIPPGEHEALRLALEQMRDANEMTHAQWRERARRYARDYVENSPAKVAARSLYVATFNKNRNR